MIRALLGYHWRYCLAQRQLVLQVLLLFLLIVILFVVSNQLPAITMPELGGSVISLAVLLSLFMSLPALWGNDYDDGSLLQWLLQPVALPLIVAIRIGICWVVFILPLVIVSPVVAYAFHMTGWGIWVFWVSLLLGSLTLYGMGAIFAALMLATQQNMALLSVLLLPCFIPVLILGGSVVHLTQQMQPVMPTLCLMLAYGILVITVSPFITAAVIRLVIRYDY